MQMKANFDEAIAALSGVVEGCADSILDLRESALASQNPGTCVRCYFAIYHQAASRAGDSLLPLQKWLERHIEIVAIGDSHEELERLPVRLEEGEELVDFCQRMMEEFHADRVYDDRKIVLRFDFTSDLKAAA